MSLQYKKLLSLDSLTQLLTQTERIIAIKCYLNQEAELTEKMQKALVLMDYHKWEPPEFKVGQDRIIRFYHTANERWHELEQYDHPIINEIQKLK